MQCNAYLIQPCVHACVCLCMYNVRNLEPANQPAQSASNRRL